jgi:polyferredoxin
VVGYDAGRAADCVDCGACVRVCPTGIDIRDGLQMECIACAACIDACVPVMAKLGRRPDLVGYFFGEPGGRARWLRPGAVALALATLASLGATVALAAERVPLQLAVAAAPDFAPRASDGRTVNAFQVVLENRGAAPLRVRLAIEAPGAEPTIRPAEVALGPGEHRDLRAVVTARLGPGGRADAMLAAEAAEPGGRTVRSSSRITLVAAEAP